MLDDCDNPGKILKLIHVLIFQAGKKSASAGGGGGVRALVNDKCTITKEQQ